MIIFEKLGAIFSGMAEKKTNPAVAERKADEIYFRQEPMSDIEKNE